jgi:lipopolysaccharide biosynthesis protein
VAATATFNPYGQLGMCLNAARHRFDRDALRFVCQVLQTLPSRPDPARRSLVLFAHFDLRDVVDPYVIHYCRELHRLGNTIIFVSGSPNLSAASVAPLRSLCAGIYTRRTLSLDFGSWHMAWNILHQHGWSLTDFDRLVLANDSVYGPLFPLEEMWDSFDGADMYGCIESGEVKPHLQSFFLAFDLNSRTRPFLDDFWQDFRYIVDKWRLVKKYEIGLSTRARRAGLRIKPYVSVGDVRRTLALAPHHQWREKLAGPPTNYPMYFYDGLIEHLRFPFLKTSLPRCRFPQHDSLDHLREFIEDRTSYPYGLIQAHLNRVALTVPEAPAARVNYVPESSPRLGITT